MAFQTRDVGGIAQNHVLDQCEEFVRVSALPVDRIEKRAWHRTIRIKPETDTGDVALILRDHVEHHAPAIALPIGAVKLRQSVFSLRNALRILLKDMDGARFRFADLLEMPDKRFEINGGTPCWETPSILVTIRLPVFPKSPITRSKTRRMRKT